VIAPPPHDPVSRVGTPTRVWKIEPDTGDIIQTTTERIAYGTPEHKARIRDVMLDLGKPRP
jgi:hypothetical protein